MWKFNGIDELDKMMTDRMFRSLYFMLKIS